MLINVLVYHFIQIILAILISWLFSFLLTITDVFPTDPEAYGYGARTDIKSESLTEVPWFYFPYPGKNRKSQVMKSTVSTI